MPEAPRLVTVKRRRNPTNAEPEPQTVAGSQTERDMSDYSLEELRLGVGIPVPTPGDMPNLHTVQQQEALAVQVLQRAVTSGLDKTIRDAFAFCNGLLPGRNDLAARLARASAAVRIIGAFSRLRSEHLYALRERERSYTPAIAEREEAAFRSVPDLAEYRVALMAGRTEQTARIRAAEQAQREVADRAAPREIVDRLHAAGVQLAVNDDGQITAPAGAKISAHDRDQIARLKDGFVAVLRADAAEAAEAAKPVVLA